MGEVRFEPATEAHARELAPRMRAADAAENLASDGFEPLEACLLSVAISDEAFAAYFGDGLGALFGLVRGPFLGFGAIPWLLTSDVVEHHPKAFVRACRQVLDDWLRRFLVLEQQIDARYAVALRWAQRLGFEVAPAAPWGAAGLPFHQVLLRRPHV